MKSETLTLDPRIWEVPEDSVHGRRVAHLGRILELVGREVVWRNKLTESDHVGRVETRDILDGGQVVKLFFANKMVITIANIKDKKSDLLQYEIYELPEQRDQSKDLNPNQVTDTAVKAMAVVEPKDKYELIIGNELVYVIKSDDGRKYQARIMADHGSELYLSSPDLNKLAIEIRNNMEEYGFEVEEYKQRLRFDDFNHINDYHPGGTPVFLSGIYLSPLERQDLTNYLDGEGYAEEQRKRLHARKDIRSYYNPLS